MLVGHQLPCNLFPSGSAVLFDLSLRGFAPGTGTLLAVTTDHAGSNTTTTSPCRIETGSVSAARFNLGLLPPGYYETVWSASAAGANGKAITATSASVSFGVVAFTSRTAAQARQEGSRFGLKVFQIGSPGVWWRRPLQWQLAETVDACSALGLQWTRHSLDQEPSPEPGIISTQELITNHAMNVVLKIEGFPESCFDAARYGSIDDWKQKKKSWSRRTVPLKGPYQQWLRETIAKIPPSQNVFEIGNEVWDYMSAEEFAAWCQLVAPVVHDVRPDALVGADPGNHDYAERFYAAGGMHGMNAAFIHPYSFTPLPEHRIRAWLRNLHDTFRARLGHDLPLYVTEYGWSTAPKPKNGKSVSERIQAQRTVRESMLLYAEDVKTLIAHWMGDREQDPANWDQWFGFFRLNGQPKPVLVAHAVSARMIDCSRFVGDLWLGPGVGAMLFERQGVRTLAVWTLDEAPNSGRNLEIAVGTDRVTVVDIMGRERQVNAPGGRLALKASGDMTYVVGLGPAVAQRAVPPDQDLIDGCWSTRHETNQLVRMSTAPQIDGQLGEWANRKRLQLAGSPADASAPASVDLAWDDAHVYAAVQVQDAVVTNRFDPAATGKVARITDGDALEITLCTRPSRQTSSEQFGALYEYTLAIAPTSINGQPALQLANIAWNKPITNPTAQDPSGIRWALVRTADGWTAEAAIPIGLLKGLSEPKAGSLLSFQVTRVDADAKGARPVRTSYAKSESHVEWPCLKLAEH